MEAWIRHVGSRSSKYNFQRHHPEGWSGVSARIKQVIDEEEGGNVSAASRRIGRSQRGLQKIYVGETEVPGSDFVEGIARKYGRDVTWLLTGVKSSQWVEHQDIVIHKAHRLAARILLATAVSLDEEVINVHATDPEPIAETSAALRRLAEVISGVDAEGKRKGA